MCYCPQFPYSTKNPVDFYVFCGITRNYAKYLYFIILLRSKLAKNIAKNAHFKQKKHTFFYIKNVCYCPKFPSVTNNPVDLYEFCWITRNYAKYLYFLVLLRSKLAQKWPKIAVFSNKKNVCFLFEGGITWPKIRFFLKFQTMSEKKKIRSISTN